MARIILFEGKRCAECKALHSRIMPIIQDNRIEIELRIYDEVNSPDFPETSDLIDRYGIMHVPALLKIQDKDNYTLVEGNKTDFDYREFLTT